MIDLELLHYFPSLQVLQYSEGISNFQQKYALDLLQWFGMVDCKTAPTPFLWGVSLSSGFSSPHVNPSLFRQLVGSLLYLTHTRPGLSFAVGLVSRFSQYPHEIHWNAAKRIMRYTQGTINFGIQYSSGASHLVVFANSNWVGSIDDRKSTFGCVYSLGFAPITWSCKNHSATLLSSMEAEYRAANISSREVLWLQKLLIDFGIHQDHPRPRFGAIIRVPYTFLSAEWKIKGQSTSRYTCTSLDDSSRMVFSGWSICLLKGKLLTSSLNL